MPDWFGDVAAGKAKDTGTFLTGTIAYMREQAKHGLSCARQTPSV